MIASDLVLLAEHFLAMYRELLLVDPFYRITVEVSDGDFISRCQPEPGSPLSWRIRLNPDRHNDFHDAKFSIVDGLLRIMFVELDRVSKSDENYAEVRDAVLIRLATIIGGLLPDEAETAVDDGEGDEA